MSSLVNYLSSWWISPEQNLEGTSTDVTSTPKKLNNTSIQKKKTYKRSLVGISAQDLLSVKLKSVKYSPARNIPPQLSYSKLDMINKIQLQDILNVKLKSVKPNKKKTIFLPRNPVLKEILQKVPKK